MKIMNEYTYNMVRKNKRHTISILASITIASALLCSLCIFVNSIWQTRVDTTIEKTGYWQGEIGNLKGDKLEKLNNNAEVETIMIKGPWEALKLSNTKRPYLLLRDGDKNFWNDMNMKNTLIEGKLPESPSEIAVSKLFFLDNPSYKIGDELTIPVGNRMLGDEILKVQSNKNANETFKETGVKKCRIVGKLDVSGSSAFPGYVTMGYLDISDIKPEDKLTVYLRFNHPINIYKVLPQIAEDTGLVKNEYGKYPVSYNDELLMLYGISDMDTSSLQILAIIVAVLIVVTLAIMAFVLIIYNAFSLSANSRIKELSILKSIGASPGQIKYSVLYEGILLYLIQLPFGILIGYAFSNVVLSKVNEILSVTEDYRKINIHFSWVVLLASIIISLITVLISAYIPARKISRVSAIDGISENTEVKVQHKLFKRKKKAVLKSNHKSLLGKLFGIEGELAGTQFAFNKKSLKISIFSLSICFILTAGYISIISILNTVTSKNDEDFNHDMTVNLNIMDEPNEEMIQRIMNLPESRDSVLSRKVKMSTFVNKSDESEEFRNAGGFDSVVNRHGVLNEEDGYRILTNLVGLSDCSFKKYCNDIGTDYKKYYDGNETYGIVLDSTFHENKNTKALEKISLLNTKPSDNLILYEKVEDDMDTDYNISVKVGDVIHDSPCDFGGGKYRINVIVPMNTYKNIVENFDKKRQMEYSFITINLLVGDEKSMEAKEKLTKICDSYIGSDDFSISSLLEEKNHNELVQKAIRYGVYAVAIMIGTIGVVNAFSTIINNLNLRKREFAMLESIGLTPGGLNKMLSLEGTLFAFVPIIISIPIVLLICVFMLNLTHMSWSEFISVFPIGSILIYSLVIFGAIFLSYWISSRIIKKNNIIETIKDEIV